MNAAGRLSLYAAGLLVAFAGAYGISAAVVPESTVAAWNEGAGMDDHSGMTSVAAPQVLPGLSLSSDGYALSPVSAPGEVGESGEMSFHILGPDGQALTEFTTSHERDLHLIVVRADGDSFTHTHPTLDEATGTWTTPWRWEQAGTYRVYADFVPDVPDAPEKVTLTRTVNVTGPYSPRPATEVATTARVDDFDLALTGDLTAGATSELPITITRDGEPVTNLQPYLGAFGHLVALRDGDLAYLHVHAEGTAPQAVETAGPRVSFAVDAPTAGRYLVYLDFQVDGQVHTAPFVVDAAPGDGTAHTPHDDTGHGSHDDSGSDH